MPDDPFDTLELPARFDLDPSEVQRKYLALSARFHPDRAAGNRGDATSGLSQPDDHAEISRLNAAKRVLDDPEQRAEALLKRLGGPAAGQDRTLPPQFLSEMLDVREQIEQAAANRDAAAFERWEDWAADRRRSHIRAVADHFARHAADLASKHLHAIRLELNVWRYTERLLEQLDGGETRSGPGAART
ncbi:MAG: DnaJ domain-containing protein [Phycisphaeraceae bacterium]|nr:DnaJ domain-containing protein [Phycisphaeraceae bacterium]